MSRGSYAFDAPGIVAAYELDAEYALPFLSHAAEAGRRRLLDFVRVHPWLVPYAGWDPNLGPCKRIVLATADPDLAAASMMARTGSDTAEGFLPVVQRLRHFAQPDLLVACDIVKDVVNARRIPDDLWPGPIPAGAPLLHPAQQTMTGFLHLANFVVGVSDLTQRDIPGILGRFDGWAPYIERLRIRAGVEPMEPDRTDASWCIVGDVMDSITDMLRAFETEIVRPAVFRIDPGLLPPQERLDFLSPGQPQAREIAGMALRLLMRDGTLPKLAETSRSWHTRSPAIARRCSLAAGDRMRAGPKLFDRMPLPDGTHLVCLNEPHELIAEGLDGPDPDGRPGLAHCVGSYVERVSNAQTFILGVRGPDPELGWRRIATVELSRIEERCHVPVVVQQRGRRNAEVPENGRIALAAVLPAIANRMRSKQGDLQKDRKDFDWTPILAEPETWEGLREAWSFAIERGRRELGHDDFLEGIWSEHQLSAMHARRP